MGLPDGWLRMEGPEVTAILAGRLRVQLGRDEGYRRWAYRDSRGHMTIGIGHLLIPDQPHTAITDEAVEAIFQDDLAKAAAIYNRVAWLDSLSEARQGAVLNLCFNLGVEGALRFRKFFEALHDGDWERAGAELLDSEWARQVGKRAERLARQIVDDEWQ